MTFNHYAKLKLLLADQKPGWYIRRIDEPTSAKTFAGDTRQFDHYYRLYTAAGKVIPYGKFQQLDRLAATLTVRIEDLPVIEP